MDQEGINKKIRFVPCEYIELGTKDNKFTFEAKQSIEWKTKKVANFSFSPKVFRQLLEENLREEKAIVIHNPWLVNEIPSAVDEGSWKSLDIGAYDKENNEIIYGYDKLTFEELTWEEKDKKKFLVGGATIVAAFVIVVLIFRGIYPKKKKKKK